MSEIEEIEKLFIPCMTDKEEIRLHRIIKEVARVLYKVNANKSGRVFELNKKDFKDDLHNICSCYGIRIKWV